MSVAVLAYHQLGYVALRTLLRLGVEVKAVFTYQDDPEEHCWFDSVSDLAHQAGLRVNVTDRINEPRWVDCLTLLQPDVLFSFYYRHLISAAILDIPRYGCVNLHGSLLPKYRGRCPINWQLIHGETTSGVTLHYMTDKADAGDIIDQASVPVGKDDHAIDLYRKLLPAAETLLERNIPQILSGTARRVPQDPSLATTFRGRRPEDGRIDWTRSALEIHNLVRAVAPPWPGAFSDSPKGRLMVYRSRAHEPLPGLAGLSPGDLTQHQGSWFAASGDGALELLEFEFLRRASSESVTETSPNSSPIPQGRKP